MNEDQILLQFQKGDQLAFKAVYEKFYESVYRFTKRLTEDTHEGENIALDLFVKLWERRENFETLQNIKAFLFISARNACLNFLKARKRNRLTTEEALAIVTEKEKVADYYIIKSEILRALDEEIQKLPNLPRQVVRLKYLEGLTTPEIAAALNISINAVRVHKSTALRLLRSAPVKRKLQWLLLLLLHFMSSFKK